MTVGGQISQTSFVTKLLSGRITRSLFDGKRNKKLVLFSADLHGNQHQFKKCFQKALDDGIDRIVFGGDIAPKSPKKRSVFRQKLFYDKFLIREIDRFNYNFFTQHGKKPLVLISLGNDDFRANFCHLQEKAKIHNFKVFCDHTFEDHEQNISYVFYSYVPYTPFKYIDWEKPDLNPKSYKDRSGARLNGLKSKGHSLIVRDAKISKEFETSIYDDLSRLFQRTKTNNTVLVSHAPPANGKLDTIKGGEHVGSRGVSKAIRDFTPLLSLHGHIHETVIENKGKYYEKNGRCISATPGNFFNEKNPFVLIVDLNNPSSIKRMEISKS